MFRPFSLTTTVHRFDGAKGWHYVPFDEQTSDALRSLVQDAWPALLKVQARVREHAWKATVMPLKNGPLFIALAAPVRKKLGVEVGDDITVLIEPL